MLIDADEIALLRDKTLSLENAAGGIADPARQSLRASRLSQTRQSVEQSRANSAPCVTRIDE